jgi:hypothetical protein
MQKERPPCGGLAEIQFDAFVTQRVVLLSSSFASRAGPMRRGPSRTTEARQATAFGSPKY